MRAMAMSSRSGAMQESEELTLELEPAPQEVYASIEATFEISEPSVLKQ